MSDPDLLADIPGWAKYLGAVSGALGAGGLFLRQWLSSAKVDRTADEATTNTIKTLQDQLSAERTRADELMHEREAMATEIGQLRGEVAALRYQVAQQTQQIETLLNLVRGGSLATALTSIPLPAVPAPVSVQNLGASA